VSSRSTLLDETRHFSTAQAAPKLYLRYMNTLRILSLSTVVLLSIDCGHCSAAAKEPAFDVASVVACPPGTGLQQWEHDRAPKFVAPGGRFTVRASSLQFLIEWAYSIEPAQHPGAPAWLATERYDITAKAEGNPTDDEMKAMLRTLLAERFHLRAHMEQRTLPVLLLSIGKTQPKITPAKEGEAHGIQAEMRNVEGKTAFHLTATRITLAQVCSILGRQLDHVLVNRTGLDGEYDFELDLTPTGDGHNPMDAAQLLTAMREQLGFNVKSDKAPVDVLIVENVEKAAAGN
jgi:uncharacterized protein (TIGR03435 family)